MMRRLVPLTGDIWLRELITNNQRTKFRKWKNLKILGKGTGQNNIRISNNLRDKRPSETFERYPVKNVNSLRQSSELKKNKLNKQNAK